MTPPEVDVSVILNIHREAPYVRRTIKSLSEAAAHAAASSIRSELIIVFDRSDALTKEATRAAPACAFFSKKYIEVDHGSLGLARNSGIDAATGEHIWLADADDLVSFNCITQMYAVAANNKNAAVFPSHLIAFGEDFWVARYFDDSVVKSADFAYGHPYISRIFLNRKHFLDLKFHDLRLSNGFAYEDWHFNAELRARGVSFKIAPKTIFFYRQRKGSLLRQANTASIRQIPHSTLFSPETFSRRVNLEEIALRQNVLDAHRDAARTVDPKEEILGDEVCRRLLVSANLIDPGVNVDEIRRTEKGWTNVFPNRHWGHDYAEACYLVGSSPITDIVLLPNLNAGGAEKYILDILQAIATQQPEFRCLVVAGEAARNHAWINRLPANCVFFDIFNSFPWNGEDERDNLLLRLILAVRMEHSRLHLKDGPFAKRWFGKFSNVIAGMFNIIYYRFGDQRIAFWPDSVDLGCSFDFVSSEIQSLSTIVCDHQRIIDVDHERFGVYADKWQCLYSAHGAREIMPKEVPSFRLLWASRICESKRPDLLLRIVPAVRRILPQIQFDVAGVFEAPDGWIQQALATAGLKYLGPFDVFEALTPQIYDAFIYTSAFDGLPNILLEAMSNGLPVVAPDVGGTSEAVEHEKTGWLIQHTTDDEILVERYVGAIVDVYRDWGRSNAMGIAGRELVIRRHSPEQHKRNVGRIFLELEE